MKFLLSFGTRPEWIKIKPLIKAFQQNNIEYNCLFTGQHTDLLTAHHFDWEITINNSNNNRLNNVIASVLNADVPWSNWDYILTQGDTASAYAVSLAAFNNNIKTIHLEAGLRSNDLLNPYPEEAYRQMISRITDINFCPTEESSQNLENENVLGKVYTVGNTVLDNLKEYKSKCSYGDTVLVTLHRRENHSVIDQWFTELNDIAKQYSELKFILPVHANPNVKKHTDILTNVHCVEPMSYNHMIDTIARSKFIITDSGGLQEEGSFLNKKVIVCRKTTERPEGIYTGHLHMCKKPVDLKKLVDIINTDPIWDAPCPYGDGNSSQKICDILLNEL